MKVIKQNLNGIKKIALLSFLLCGLRLFGQVRENFSIEIGPDYYYYFISKNTHNYFNFGSSVLCSYYSGSIKFSLGINYSTRNTFDKLEPVSHTNFIYKTDRKVKMVNIPAIMTFGIDSSKRMKPDFYFGVIFNRIKDYNVTSFYSNDSVKTANGIVNSDQKYPISIRLGMNISKPFKNHLVLSLSPFVNYMIVKGRETRPIYLNLPDDRMSLGLKFGIEYKFFKN